MNSPCDASQSAEVCRQVSSKPTLRFASFIQVISEATSYSIRSNARIVGLILQCVAVVTLLGAFVAAFDVAQKGQQYLNVAASHDPAAWIVLAIGVIASLIFAGLGYSLAMLCALYDRQITVEASRGAFGSAGPIPRLSTEWRTPPTHELGVREGAAPTPQKTYTSPVTAPTPTRSGLWSALTKERHIKKPRD